MPLNIKLVSSLEKIFPKSEPKVYKSDITPTMLKGEVYSYQIAYSGPPTDYSSPWLYVEIESPIKELIDIKKVDLVPADYTAPFDADENYLLTEPALIPDILMPLDKITLKCVSNYWQSLWVSIDTTKNANAGIYEIKVLFKNKAGVLQGESTFTIEILNIELPKTDFILTNWFHADCISSYYKFEILSEEHFSMIEKFLKVAYNHGMNMILTPLFTLPLDTEVYGERPTLQLVDVIKTNNTYRFNFDKLKRWIDMCKNIGFEYFEMSHLFTQWGANFTPKIVALVNNEYKQIFGWNVSANDISYKIFLDSFLPKLVEFLKQQNIADKCYFHISDEPNKDSENSYRFAKSLVESHLKDFIIIDALSDIEFYQKGLVNNPVTANNHIEPFLDAKVPNLWTYYCVAQSKEVSNRFMAMPSARNRIIGTQLFKFDIKGFLHWGFNFYYSQFSKEVINPFRVTDAGCAFPAGDPFLVYPGEDGPIDSIRLKVFTEAIYDLRTMQFLEKLTSKEYVTELIEKNLDEPITFIKYPKEAEYILNLKQILNNNIKKYLK